MSFFGADTDELREAAKKCEETAKVTDDTIMFLKALVIILMAASVWTGGSSAAYAKYLQSTVIPWLQKISMALHLMAKVLGEHAQAQDEVSEGRNVDFSRLTQWQMPTLPTTSAREYPVMTFPAGGCPPAVGAGTGTGSGPLGAPGTTGTVPDLAIGGGFGGALGNAPGGGGTGTFSGGAGQGLGSGGLGGLGGGSGSGSLGGGSGAGAGTGSGDFTGSAGSALGSGVTPGSTPGTTGGGSVGEYTGSAVGPESGTGPAPIVGTSTDGGSNTGTYAAAGAAGLLGAGGAAALAGAGGLGQGKGFTSPNGFDYNRIKGVKDNPNVTPEFLRRTEQIATKLGCKPEDLLAVMSFETGESFSPSKKNPGSSATGLIQFMDATAKGLGTTTAELRGMTSVQQLDYVEKYFGNGKYSTLEELYSKVLAGHKISDPEKVLFTAGTQNYAANKNLDLKLGNGDGRITLAEATNAVRRKVTAGN